MDIKHISVIGLGAMGTPIASFLLKAGYHVSGFDIAGKQMSKLTKKGLRPVKSPKEAAKGADLIILSLRNWGIVMEVLEGKDGLLEGAGKGQIIVDTSTVPPWESKSMAKKLAKKGIEWIDAPISGSASQARVGNMVFMAGGKKSVFNRVKPILDKVGKKTVYVGKSGDAAMLKLVVNQTLFLNQAAAIEGFVLGLKAGLDPKVMLDVMSSGAAGSDLIISRGEDMLNGKFDPKGPIWLAVKDVELILESAKQMGVVLPMGSLYHQLLLRAHFSGWDQEDATVVMKIYEQLADIKQKDKKPLQRKKKI